MVWFPPTYLKAASNRLGLKGLQVTNTLAYYEKSENASVKSLITQGFGVGVKQKLLSSTLTLNKLECFPLEMFLVSLTFADKASAYPSNAPYAAKFYL